MPLWPLRFALVCAAILSVGAGTAAGASAAADPTAMPTVLDPALPAVAASADLTVEGGRTRLVVTLSKPVDVHAFVMERPDRVVVDLPEVNFQLPAESGRRREGLVASFRYGLFAPGRSRLVIDLTQPAQVARAAVATRPVDGAALLTIELTRTDRDTFRKAAVAESHLASETGPAPAPEAANDRRPLVVIDPGHGGVDPGATAADGLEEKDIVFAYAGDLKAKLEAGGRYRVMLTRNEDVFIPLDERVRIARAAKADLFVSIHADTISAAQVRGLTVYTRSERASDTEAASVADRENKADAVAGLSSDERPDEVADILQELTLRETQAFSQRFATRLVGALDTVTKLNKNPHRHARFRVLRAPDVPSVLIELGYLSSKRDLDLLLSDQWRERSTGAMSAAIDRFFSTRIANQGPAPVSP